MMFNMTIYNKSLYENSGEHLSMVVQPAFELREVMRLLKCEMLEDLAVQSYELPFELSGIGWEVIGEFASSESAFRLREIDGTPYGDELMSIAKHFYEGNLKKALVDWQYIHFCKNVTSYSELLAYVINTGIVEADFLYLFLDINECVRMLNAQYERNFTVKEFEKATIKKIIEIFDVTDLFQIGDFLKHDELYNYLRKSFNVLETKNGFFIDQQRFLNAFSDTSNRKMSA